MGRKKHSAWRNPYADYKGGTQIRRSKRKCNRAESFSDDSDGSDLEVVIKEKKNGKSLASQDKGGTQIRRSKRKCYRAKSSSDYSDDSDGSDLEVVIKEKKKGKSLASQDKGGTQIRRSKRKCYRAKSSSDDSDGSDLEVVIKEKKKGKSLGSQDSSSSKSSPLSVTFSDTDVLDCPICFEALKIPIFQCDNGHLACSLCCIKVRKKCPSCALAISTRNRAMENVIETSRVSCRNAKYGCKETTSYGNRSTHEKLCAFSPFSCPICSCNYTSNYKDLNNHVRYDHEHHVIPVNCNSPFTISLYFKEKTTIMYLEEDDDCVIVVQTFRASHAALISVSCIAPLAPEVSKFSCSLVNKTVNGLLLKQSFMVKNIQKVKDEQPEDGFILMPSYMFDGECFKVQICISRDPVLVQT